MHAFFAVRKHGYEGNGAFNMADKNTATKRGIDW